MISVSATLAFPAFTLDVAFEALAGVTVLFGPTASGKSLTLRLLAGLERATTGSVRFDGTLWDEGGVFEPPHVRGLGYAPQRPALWPHMTARAHVEAFTTREHATELLARVNLSALADRRPDRFSGGEQQRLSLARALARSPRVLLLDEPFSALDDAAREAMGALVRTHAEKLEDGGRAPGATGLGKLPASLVLFVTHDRAEAERLADKFVVCREGHVREASSLRP